MFQFSLHHSLPVISSSDHYKSTGNIHHLPAASTKELIVYLISICETVPQSYEILRCHGSTAEAEIMQFLQRIVYFPRNYIVIEVNVLPSLLQEVKKRYLIPV